MPTGIYKHKYNKGRLGQPHTEETKNKIRLKKKGNKYNLGSHRTIEQRKRMSLAQKGRKLTEEHKKKLSESHKGKPSHRKGKKLSEETKEKLRQYSGKNHWNWQGGKSFEVYSFDWNETLRRSIRERDNYVCQLCNKLQGDRVLSVHHIDYNPKNNDPKNLISLCINCHARTNVNRKKWIGHFTLK